MNKEGRLFLVGTPIGNLEDISIRALKILKDVDLIAAEDTRHSRKLTEKYGISTPLTSFRHHNQKKAVPKLLKQLSNGSDVALICDAGTPAISDPGALLVSAAHQQGIPVVPIPGASALTAALSACGIAFDEMLFLGFLPPKRSHRRKKLEQLANESRCFVFFEAPHRMVESLKDMVELLGAECPAVIAREMTKIHETIRTDDLGNLLKWVLADPNQTKGEFVMIVDNSGCTKPNREQDADRILEIMLVELSPRQAAQLTSKILGQKRNILYRRAIELKNHSRTSKQ